MFHPRPPRQIRIIIVIMSKPISRVLSWTIIYLGLLSPISSSEIPMLMRAAIHHFSCSGWGLHSQHCCQHCGELLPRLSILTKRRFISVALSLKLPPPVVNWHPALWSSDFPPAKSRRPTGLLIIIFSLQY